MEFIQNKLRQKIRESEEYRKFSLSNRKQSRIKMLYKQEEYITGELIKTCLNKYSVNRKKQFAQKGKFYSTLLETLNKGEYKFSKEKPGYIVNPYHGKARLILDSSVKKRKKQKKVEKGYEHKLVISLLSLKLTQNLNKEEQKPSRQKVIKDLINYLQNNKDSNLIIIRGDFKNYTLNIPRKRLLKILEKRETPEHILKLINSYLEEGNKFSSFIKRGNVEKFFKNVGLKEELEKDTDFKGFLNLDGLFPGTPISNILGQIFLLDFDKKMKEIVGKNGFFVRYFDDFILIKSFKNNFTDSSIQKEKREIEEKIYDFIATHYQITPDKVKNIIEIEKSSLFLPKQTKEEKIYFLGYSLKITNKRIKISIRYKTLKKFVYKYLYEHNYSNFKSKTLSKVSCLLGTPYLNIFDIQKVTDITVQRYLRGKLFYLYNWMRSFIYINDKRLLDEIYTNIILPDLYLFFKRYGNNTTIELKQIKPYYRLTVIHRICRKKINDCRGNDIFFINQQIHKIFINLKEIENKIEVN